ncbi:MAG: excinuclease ABC subunit UvrA [Ruminococcaceae bacterium]|nr:excinuclease ABC subunit UvrA [Oscillospiraceae bacterium]
MAKDSIFIKGARQHNLKNIDVTIPRDKLVVLTGLSGSGKSSLAFDTIYAEGQRRYVESLSAYARQFLGQMDKPDVDYIEGLSPAISIDQKTTSKNPRSTVGTVTEVYDYIRLLYARIGIPHCHICGKPIARQSTDQIIDKVLSLPEKSRIHILAPVVRARKGEHQKVFSDAIKSGYVRVRVDGIVYDLTEVPGLEKNKKHSIEILIDRMVIREDIRQRLTDSVETALKLSGGTVIVDVLEKEEMMFSQNFACEDCGVSMEELTPRMFSFNSPFGACEECSGLGFLMKIDPDLVVRDENKSINEGALAVSGWRAPDIEDSVAAAYYRGLSKHYNFSLDVPYKELPEKIKNIFLYGTKGEKFKVEFIKNGGHSSYLTDFEGLVNNLQRRYNETTSDWMRAELEGYMTNAPCSSCEGKRLKPQVLAVTVGGKNIVEMTDLSIVNAIEFFNTLKLSEKEQMIAEQILKEILERLNFLKNVGLGYLTLSRSAGTLSGGEAQRIRLATQIGSSLMGVLYILDEPSIGLHQRDNEKLIATLKTLRDLGNTLVVVEHDEDTMYAADYIIDIGPGAGVHGGEIVAQGTAEEVKKVVGSATGDYLSGRKFIPIPDKRRTCDGKYLTVKGASENNLKNVDVDIPLGVFTCVTGVSGSGKSSLVNEIIYKYLAHELNRARTKHGKVKKIDGIKQLDKVINIDQSPIGRTPRSNPATYTGLFSDIRELFASTVEAKVRGYNAGRFSFNVKGGRCEACCGDGILQIEMHFLPDVYVPCEVCKGKRYSRETLEVKYKGKDISEVLDMTVEEALEFFENIPKLKRKIQTLYDVGLGYVKLGQPSTTLSGGEAQRVKLATELSKRSTGKTIYILDEPTTGLHTADVHRLLEVLDRLVESGNSVVVIEHNLDVIKTADYIIDLGPDGGDAGGQIVCTGTPEQVAECGESFTGIYLKKLLEKSKKG